MYNSIESNSINNSEQSYDSKSSEKSYDSMNNSVNRMILESDKTEDSIRRILDSIEDNIVISLSISDLSILRDRKTMRIIDRIIRERTEQYLSKRNNIENSIKNKKLQFDEISKDIKTSISRVEEEEKKRREDEERYRTMRNNIQAEYAAEIEQLKASLEETRNELERCRTENNGYTNLIPRTFAELTTFIVRLISATVTVWLVGGMGIGIFYLIKLASTIALA